MRTLLAAAVLVLGSLLIAAEPASLVQAPNTWVKRSPLKDAPPSPGLGYEAALAWDPVHQVVIRFGGHNQGGGGEQNAETWTFDPRTAKWTLKEPNTSPPGVCCAQQNLFDPVQDRYLRFTAFSGNHGWHWFRQNYLSNSSLWNYDLATNTWRDMRPVPAPRVSPLRCASWDSDHQVAVVFGGEGNQEGTVVYDPYTNSWTRMNPPVQPAFRSGGNMTYDAAHKLHILFGAQFTNDPHTWAYDLAKNEWRDLKPERQPPTDRNDPVLAYDSVNRVVIASTRVIDKEDGKEIVAGHHETWAFDAGKNTWTPLQPATEPAGSGNRRRIMIGIPDLNVILLENYVNPAQRVPGVDREQQIWTYRYAEPKRANEVKPPSGVSITTDAQGATVNWKPTPSANVAGYAIYRGTGSPPWRVAYKQVARREKAQTSYRDTTVKPGEVHHYFVRAVTADEKESADSVKVRTQPRVVEDVVVSVIGAKEVHIGWTAPGPDAVGYHVERAVVDVFSDDQVLRLKKDTAPLTEPSVGTVKAIGPFVRLTKEALKETRFTDQAIDLAAPQAAKDEPIFTHRFRDDQLDAQGKPYRFAVFAYRIRAVNALGVESGPSPYSLTIPSSPKGLFSKEAGDDCQLKWQANPEQQLKGYRVYRMESPRINGPGQKVSRVTADPITETHYTDAKIGTATRRYWIVAVDALGQEGIPSAPAWHYREYRRFYVPFVGEWHQ